MDRVSPLLAEYRLSAGLYLLVAAAGLVADLTLRDHAAGPSLAAFAIMAAVTGAVLAVTALRWLNGAMGAAERIGRRPVEGGAQVIRRSVVEVLLVAILMVGGMAGQSRIGVVIAGVAAGVGLANAVGSLMVRRRQRDRGVTLYRQAPVRLIANGRRPLFVR